MFLFRKGIFAELEQAGLSICSCNQDRHSHESVYMGITRACLTGFDKVRFNPACSATETNWIIEISLQASLDKILPNKGTDQTERMGRLV